MLDVISSDTSATNLNIWETRALCAFTWNTRHHFQPGEVRNYSTSTGTWFPWWKLFLQCIICSCSCTILNDSSTGVSSLFGAILKLWIVAFLIVLITVFLIFKSICMHKASAKWMHASVKVWCDVLTCISHLLMLRINPGVFLMKKQAFYLTLFELKGLFVQVKTLPHNARITHGNTT